MMTKQDAFLFLKYCIYFGIARSCGGVAAISHINIVFNSLG